MLEVNSIVEGCMPDTPEKLMYSGTEFQVPENARVLLWSHEYHPSRFLLYAETRDFADFEVLNNPFFQSRRGLDANKLIKLGLPLRDYEPNFNWIFDAQRSLISRDGRIYIEATYFESDWRWYLKAVPTILRECGMIFKGEESEDYFCDNPTRIL